MKELTPKQALFVAEYLRDLSASTAARRAGYSEKAACDVGHQLLRKPHSQAAIESAKAARSARCMADADTVLRALTERVLADPVDIYDELGRFKPITQWPPIWRQRLVAVEIEEQYAPAQNGEKSGCCRPGGESAVRRPPESDRIAWPARRREGVCAGD